MFNKMHTYCEAMQENPAMVLTMLEEFGYMNTSPRQKAVAKVREAYEQFGAEVAEEIAHQYGLTLSNIEFE